MDCLQAMAVPLLPRHAPVRRLALRLRSWSSWARTPQVARARLRAFTPRWLSRRRRRRRLTGSLHRRGRPMARPTAPLGRRTCAHVCVCAQQRGRRTGGSRERRTTSRTKTACGRERSSFTFSRRPARAPILPGHHVRSEIGLVMRMIFNCSWPATEATLRISQSNDMCVPR